MVKNERDPKQVGDNSWLGNVGITSAKIQEIDNTVEPPKWKTLGECLDTPNAIKQELQNPKYLGHDVWIRDAFGDRQYHGTIKQQSKPAVKPNEKGRK
jgi:hypothetical protein